MIFPSFSFFPEVKIVLRSKSSFTSFGFSGWHFDLSFDVADLHLCFNESKRKKVNNVEIAMKILPLSSLRSSIIFCLTRSWSSKFISLFMISWQWIPPWEAPNTCFCSSSIPYLYNKHYYSSIFTLNSIFSFKSFAFS